MSSQKNSLLRFAFMSFMIQIMISVPVTIAISGSSMLNNNVATTAITQSVGNVTGVTDSDIVTEETIRNLDAETPIEYFIEGVFNIPYYISLLVSVTVSLIGTTLMLGALAIGYGTIVGGVIGTILGLFGVLYYVWQLEILRRILWTMIGRG